MGVRADAGGPASTGVPPGGLAEAASAVPASNGIPPPPGGGWAAGSAAATVSAEGAMEPLRHGQQNQNLEVGDEVPRSDWLMPQKSKLIVNLTKPEIVDHPNNLTLKTLTI